MPPLRPLNRPRNFESNLGHQEGYLAIDFPDAKANMSVRGYRRNGGDNVILMDNSVLPAD